MLFWFVSAAAVLFCSWITLGICKEQKWLCIWGRSHCVPWWGFDHCTVQNRTTGNCPVIFCIFPPFTQHQFVPASIKHWFYHMEFHVPEHRGTETLWADGREAKSPPGILVPFQGRAHPAPCLTQQPWGLWSALQLHFLFAHSSIYWPADTSFCGFIPKTHWGCCGCCLKPSVLPTRQKTCRKLPGYLCGEWVVFITSSLRAKSLSFSETYKFFFC